MQRSNKIKYVFYINLLFDAVLELVCAVYERVCNSERASGTYFKKTNDLEDEFKETKKILQ